MRRDGVCATREDVAKQAGVSVTVVSYVVNNNRYVDKEKRARVLKAIEELNYRPNNIARALKGKSSNHILFIVDNPANERLSVLLAQMDKFAYEKGSIISLCATRNTSDFMRQIISRRFDGIIISSTSLQDAYIQQLVDAGIPTVLLLTRDYPHVHGAATIGTGLHNGAKECVQYFYDQGRRHLIYIDRISQRNHFSNVREDFRLRGFVEQMEALGMPWQDRVITGCTSEEQLQQAVATFARSHPLDAVLGRNDQMACMAMQQLLRMGRRVPEDVGVIGFDDSSISRFVTPSITSMRMPEENLARMAIEMLEEIRAGNPPTDGLWLAARMIVRESTERAEKQQTDSAE